LTYSGELKVIDKHGVPYAMTFQVGKYNKAGIVSNPDLKYDPNTGDPISKEKILSGKKIIYDIEVPADQAKRKKLIESVIGDSYKILL
jgi:hypothetical protein